MRLQWLSNARSVQRRAGASLRSRVRAYADHDVWRWGYAAHTGNRLSHELAVEGAHELSVRDSRSRRRHIRTRLPLTRRLPLAHGIAAAAGATCGCAGRTTRPRPPLAHPARRIDGCRKRGVVGLFTVRSRPHQRYRRYRRCGKAATPIRCDGCARCVAWRGRAHAVWPQPRARTAPHPADCCGPLIPPPPHHAAAVGATRSHIAHSRVSRVARWLPHARHIALDDRASSQPTAR